MRDLNREEQALFDAEQRAISANIRAIREGLGLSQADLARLLDCTQQQILLYESVQQPQHYRLVQLALVMGLNSTIPLRLVRETDAKRAVSPVPKAPAAKAKKRRATSRAK